MILMNRFLNISLAAVLGFFLFAPDGLAFDLESRYATITYYDHSHLKKFNHELYMGQLSSLVRSQGADTIEEEVVAKINAIVEKAMKVMDMFPEDLDFCIVIHPNERDVQREFKEIYDVDVGYIAFYSPHLNRIYYSANNGTLRVVTHEIAHVIVENYFKVSPPQRIHEVLAQYAEKHIND